jgi:hypothetical protein
VIQLETIYRMLDNQLVHHYLLASFCYYHLHESPMTDAAFDVLCNRLQKRLPYATCDHAKIVNPDDLDAGTCLLPYDHFPRIVTVTAFDYIFKCRMNTMQAELEPHLALVARSDTTRIRRSKPVEVAEPVRRIRRSR